MKMKLYLEMDTAMPVDPGASIANRFMRHRALSVQASSVSSFHSSSTIDIQVGASSNSTTDKKNKLK